MLHKLKRFIPPTLLLPYHYVLVRIAEFVYGHPSNKLIVIGVTGTNGKSSTVVMCDVLLRALGRKSGYTSTAGFVINRREIPNRLKMTMPGRFLLQRLLRDMVREGCGYAIVETSSQGVAQFRHLGVNYDVAVFTNLTPEHIEAHGGFDAYKEAKEKLFAHLMARPHKTIDGKRIAKINVVNADDEHAAYFAAFSADRHVAFAMTGNASADRVVATIIARAANGTTLDVSGIRVDVPLVAEFEIANALAAIAAVHAAGFPLEDVVRAAAQLHAIPGRFEHIDCGQPFTVIVDYAYEPYALAALYRSVRALNAKRILGLHGSAGGGRDIARRGEIGKLAAREEDITMVTNEDPYDENPQAIIDAVLAGARESGKRDDVNLFWDADRGLAIRRLLAMAKEGDVVLITGKGSEPVMAVAGGKKISFDDREQTRRALGALGWGSGKIGE